MLPLLFVASYPFIWLLILGNHSQIHYYMTYRNILVFFLAMNIFVVEAFKINIIKIKNKERVIK
ncbi:hypothetical protein K380107A5_11060 [Holdemania massiliensis]